VSQRKPVRYSDAVRPEDTEKAATSLTATLVPDDARPLAIDFGGSCPRCSDPIQVREWLVVVAGALKMNTKQMQSLASTLVDRGSISQHGEETFDLTCSCGIVHPDRPDGKIGCGARFSVQASW